MQETLFIRFHEIILIVYLISILCYFIDFVRKSHKIRVLGIYALGIVWFYKQSLCLCILLRIVMYCLIPYLMFFLLVMDDYFYFLVLNIIKVLSFSVFFECNWIYLINDEYI